MENNKMTFKPAKAPGECAYAVNSDVIIAQYYLCHIGHSSAKWATMRFRRNMVYIYGQPKLKENSPFTTRLKDRSQVGVLEITVCEVDF